MELQELRQWLEEIEAGLLHAPPQRISKAPRAASGDTDGGMAAKTAPHLQLLELYGQKQEALAAAILEVESLIGRLGPIDRRIFRHKYLENMTFEQIAELMHYSRQGISKRHRAALNQLEAEEKRLYKR